MNDNKNNTENSSNKKEYSLSDEHKQAISKGSIGKPGTNTGKTFSEDHKEKMSISHKGMKFTEEHKKNLSEAHKGQQPANTKLTYEQAELLRADKKIGMTYNQLQEKYGVSHGTITCIVQFRSHKAPPISINKKND